jgi:phosphatidylserine/phosphatidylglycerophosphate/cardiolipin synthase-like enzyme
MKTILISIVLATFFLPAAPITSVIFAPTDKSTEQLLQHISNAKKSIHAAVYMLTDKRISEALINAHRQRRIDVKLLLDPVSTSKFGKADDLATAGITVYIFTPPKLTRFFDAPLMHNKFAIFDGKIIWTGSLNWTVAASGQNRENVIVTDMPDVCKAYTEEFKKLISMNAKLHRTAQSLLPAGANLKEKLQALLAKPTSDALLYEQLAALVDYYQP